MKYSHCRTYSLAFLKHRCQYIFSRNHSRLDPAARQSLMPKVESDATIFRTPVEIPMDLATITLFVPACFALNMAPGPNNLLSLSNASRYGFRLSCAAGLGRLLAFVGMLSLAVVLHTSELLFYGIKIVGAAYLLYLAFQLWCSDPALDSAADAPRVGLLALARQEFLVAAGNPKAILIFTAFLPQFIDPAQAVAPQFALLA